MSRGRTAAAPVAPVGDEEPSRAAADEAEAATEVWGNTSGAASSGDEENWKLYLREGMTRSWMGEGEGGGVCVQGGREGGDDQVLGEGGGRSKVCVAEGGISGQFIMG